MCINPSILWIERGPKWEQMPIPCKTCWRCKQNRVNDYVARCMAEMSVSSASCAITLTYAPRDDLADKVLNKKHFQLFIKRLRRAGHSLRYLVAGEYGDLKGRAHFHALLFFTHLEPASMGAVPFYNRDHVSDPDLSAPFSAQIPNMDMVHISQWPHGHVTVDWSANERAARYVCKYLLKADKNNAWFSLSKKPALGAAWFAKKAATAVDLDVLPRTFEYLPPGGSKDRPYLMTGATRRDYLAAITTNPERRKAMSEWVQKSFDKYALQRLKKALELEPQDVVDACYQDLYDRKADLEAAKQRRDKQAIDDYIDRAITSDCQYLPKGSYHV